MQPPNVQKTAKLYALIRAHQKADDLVDAVEKVLGATGAIEATHEQITSLFSLMGLACDLRSAAAAKLEKEMSE